MTKTNTEAVEFIPLDKLELDPMNVRRREPSESLVRDIAEDIEANGLAHALLIRPNRQKRYVSDGGVRWRALKLLDSEDRLPASYEDGIPCNVKKMTAKEARKRSLQMNALRENTHPADEFEAFAQMAKDGADVQSIAKEFRKSELHVKQRMKLGQLHPDILDALRNDLIELSAATAYAFCEDQSRQLEVFERLGPGAPQHQIRDHIRTEDSVTLRNHVAAFVGIEDYEAAGGTVKVDMFDEQQTTFEDQNLVLKVASRKLQCRVEQLKAEGWGWAEGFVHSPGYEDTQNWTEANPDIKPEDYPEEARNRVEEIAAEMDALEEKRESGELSWMDASHQLRRLERELDGLTELNGFSEDQKSQLGAYVFIDNSGQAAFVRGLTDRRNAAQGEALDGEKPKQPEQPAGLIANSAQAERMGYLRTKIARNSVAANPNAALTLVIAAQAEAAFDNEPSYERGAAEAAFTTRRDMTKLPESWELKTDGEFEARFEAWRDRLTQSGKTIGEAVAALDQADQLDLLAVLTAAQVTLTAWGQAEGADARGVYAASLLGDEAEASAHFIPAEDFFKSLKTRQIEACILDMGGAPDPKAKKAALVKAAAKLAEQTGWTPPSAELDGPRDRLTAEAAQAKDEKEAA